MTVRFGVQLMALLSIFAAVTHAQSISVSPGATATVQAMCGTEKMTFRVRFPLGASYSAAPPQVPAGLLPPNTAVEFSSSAFRARPVPSVEFDRIDGSEIRLRNDRGFVAVMKPVGDGSGPAYAQEVQWVKERLAVAVEWGSIAIGRGPGRCLDGDLAALVLADNEQLKTAAAQRLLKTQGLYKGQIDGRPGAQSTAAVTALQKRAGMAPNGQLDASTMLALIFTDAR